jgi:hypothetical protein
MWRAFLGILLAIGALGGARPAAAQDECPAVGDTPEDAASTLVAGYLAGGQWDMAYDVLHPEAQLRVPRQVFAGARQGAAMAAPVLDVEVFPARTSVGWTWGVTGVRFTNVAEVPVRVTRGAFLGAMPPVVEVIPLVNFQGCWRWLPPVLP